MASLNEPSSAKKRLGRRRLPPLEPGPALQFVIANHPDQFRAGETMRHIRSHVMYKHRIERKSSTTGRTDRMLQRSASAHASSNPSPVSIDLDESASDVDYLAPPPSRPRSGTWTADSSQHMSDIPSSYTLRTLIDRILSSTQGVCARSAPPTFEDASAFPFPGFYGTYSDHLDDLRQHYIENYGFYSGDKQWMRTICADQMAFLSHVSVSSVYQDLADGFWQESDTTVQVKTHALRAIAGQVESNDATILSILHLLLSEVGGDESAFRVHYQGLQGLINKRGGMCKLSDQLITYLTLILTTLATLKVLPVSTPSPWSDTILSTHPTFPYLSPLYAPHGTLTPLRTICSMTSLEILIGIHTLTQSLLHSHATHTSFVPTQHHYLAHDHLLRLTPQQDPAIHDWVFESIRIAAQILSHAILLRTSLATSANISYHATSTAANNATSTGGTTLLTALLAAVERTDVASCWGTLRGVLVWVCIIGAAACDSIPRTPPNTALSGTDRHGAFHLSPHVSWPRKCFSLWAARAVVSGGFEHAGGLVEMLRVGGRVREILDGWEG